MTTAEINLKKKRLHDYEKIVRKNEQAIIGTHNKETGWDGCASILPNQEEMIKVFEGNPDGSDDKVMSFYKFVKNYSFGIGVEISNGNVGVLNEE